MKGKSSFSTSITLLVLGASFILLAVYLTLSYSYQKAQFRELSEQHVSFIGPRLILITQRFISLDAQDLLDSELQSIQKLPGIGLIALVDQKHNILYASDPDFLHQNLRSTPLASATEIMARPATPVDQSMVQLDDDRHIVGIFPFPLSDSQTLDKKSITHAVINVDLQKTYESIQKAILTEALIIGLLLIIITAILWYLLRREVILPLQKIVAKTRAIAAGDFIVRSQLSPNNELGEISATLDSLAQTSREQVDVQNAHRRLSQVVEGLVDEVVVCDAKTFEIVNSNKAIQSNLGYSAEELKSMKPWQFVAGHTRAGLISFLTPLIDGTVEQLSCESDHLCKDGTTYPVRVRMQYMAHQAPPVLVAISQDLSELRNQEEHALLSKRAMEAVSEGIIITDAGQHERMMVYANQAICDMSGFSVQELLGKNAKMLRKNGDSQPGLIKMKEAFEKRESVLVQFESIRKDGSTYTIEVSMSPVFNSSGKLTNYIGIHRDITQKLLTEQKLHQAQRIKAIGQLSGGVAHDFNNLLSVIVGNLELLKGSITDKSQTARIEGAESAAHMGAHLTRRLLSFASQQKLTPAVTNVNDHIRNTTALLAPTIGETISLTEDLTSNLWNTLSDPGEIETAVINLTINARDAMTQGGTIVIKTANVTLEQKNMDAALDIKPGEYVKLCVMDNGPGICKAVQERIFEPFFTTKQDSKGSGLGLASVFGFAKQSGGCVKVVSSPDTGTAVSIYLPRHQPEDAALLEKPGHAGSSESCFQGLRILVVEDKEMVRELTVQQLQFLGFSTLQVENGVNAIELLQSGVEVDVVFSDVVMPGGMSGYDVAQWIKSNRPECRVMLTSGFDEPAGWEGKGQVVDLHVLQKPYRMDDLRRALQDALKIVQSADSVVEPESAPL